MRLGLGGGRRGQHQKSCQTDSQPGFWQRCILAPVLLAAICCQPAFAAEPLAVFDVEIYDTSGEGAHADLAERLARISGELRDGLAASPDYDLVDLAPAAERIEALGYIYGCNGCEARIAREFGATTYVTTLIHKVSTLILSIRIRMHDAETGDVIEVATADIRGDNDRAWSHGISWLLRNRILAD